MPKKIIVVGSINTDMIVFTDNFPQAGETILANSFHMVLGGKGANQAVAAARLGASVTFISRVGEDVYGNQAINRLENERIDVSYISRDTETSSGVALINVNKNAENTIVVSPGANNTLTVDAETLEKLISEETIVVMQLEIPLHVIEQVCDFAKTKKATVILNPAPAAELTSTILSNVSIITPNQTEAKSLVGIDVVDDISADLAAASIQKLGPEIVIITMGDEGAFVKTKGSSFKIEAQKVQAVDTTAAGDVFNGALAYALSRDYELFNAVDFASRAAAISVTRLGAQDSAPTIQDLSTFYNNN